MSITASFCRSCGRELTAEEKAVPGNVTCSACIPVAQAATQPLAAGPPPGPETPSAGIAFVLGLIPGVGAIYNGQYAKGLIHVLILGSLFTIVEKSGHGLEPLFALLIPGFWAYMAFEAYHTAKRRLSGEKVDEFSSLLPLKGEGFPVGPVLLIAFGVVALLVNLDLIHLGQIVKYWPVLLIGLGVYLLYARVTQIPPPTSRIEEASREQ
jgi:hypothetical protein